MSFIPRKFFLHPGPGDGGNNRQKNPDPKTAPLQGQPPAARPKISADALLVENEAPALLGRSTGQPSQKPKKNDEFADIPEKWAVPGPDQKHERRRTDKPGAEPEEEFDIVLDMDDAIVEEPKPEPVPEKKPAVTIHPPQPKATSSFKALPSQQPVPEEMIDKSKIYSGVINLLAKLGFKQPIQINGDWMLNDVLIASNIGNAFMISFDPLDIVKGKNQNAVLSAVDPMVMELLANLGVKTAIPSYDSVIMGADLNLDQNGSITGIDYAGMTFKSRGAPVLKIKGK